MAARCLLLKYALSGGKPELVALQITDWADTQCNSGYTKLWDVGSVVTFSVEDRLCISKNIHRSLKSDHYLLWMFLACTFWEFVHKCNMHDTTISVTHTFLIFIAGQKQRTAQTGCSIVKG